MDLETCSWCLAEVEWKTLKSIADGANICPDCYAEYLADLRKGN